jgi:hypothetical protein
MQKCFAILFDPTSEDPGRPQRFTGRRLSHKVEASRLLGRKEFFSRRAQFWKPVEGSHSCDAEEEPPSQTTSDMSESDNDSLGLAVPSRRSTTGAKNGGNSKTSNNNLPVAVRYGVNSSKKPCAVARPSLGAEQLVGRESGTISSLPPPSRHSIRSIQITLDKFEDVWAWEKPEKNNSPIAVTTTFDCASATSKIAASNSTQVERPFVQRKSVFSDQSTSSTTGSIHSNNLEIASVSSSSIGPSARTRVSFGKDPVAPMPWSWDYSDMDLSGGEQEDEDIKSASSPSRHATSHAHGKEEQFTGWRFGGWSSPEQFQQLQLGYSGENVPQGGQCMNDLLSPRVTRRASTGEITTSSTSNRRRRRSSKKRSKKKRMSASSAPESVEASIVELVEFLTPNSSIKRKVYLQEFQ